MKPNSGLCLSLILSVLAVSCGERGSVPITEVRELDPANQFEVPVIEESDLKRLRLDNRMAGASQGLETDEGPKLVFKAPDGWTELPPAPFRDVNMAFGENREGECYVTRLGSTDLVGNVNRWLRQIGAEPLTDEQVAALPKKTLLGHPAILVTSDGTFSGMGGSGAKEGYRLHGLILALDGAMMTVKMTGPKALITENEAKFDAFCASLDLRSRNQ